jgi:hypothetical protein
MKHGKKKSHGVQARPLRIVAIGSLPPGLTVDDLKRKEFAVVTLNDNRITLKPYVRFRTLIVIHDAEADMEQGRALVQQHAADVLVRFAHAGDVEAMVALQSDAFFVFNQTGKGNARHLTQTFHLSDDYPARSFTAGLARAIQKFRQRQSFERWCPIL